MSKNSESVMSFVKRRKSNLIKVFDSKCCICGFDKFQEALEFHHVNPEEKEFSIGGSHTITKSLEKQLTEMKKCILVCANCHRGIHQGYYSIPTDYQNFYNEEVANQLLEELYFVNGKKEWVCQSCGAPISYGAQYCEPCSKIARRIVERPSREELKVLIRSTSFLQIGKIYGVSDNAVRKWCDSYNLPRKSSEIKAYSDEEWDEI